MKPDSSVMMSEDGSSGHDRSSSPTTPSNESLPPSVVHVSRDELRKFLKCKRVGNYLIGKTIGEGSFAKVKQGFHVLTGEKVAVKIIDKKQAMEDRYVSKNMRREAKILQMVRHPNVIQLLEVVETENRYYLVFEVAGGGDLMDYICYRKKLGEIEVRKFIRQIISAVHYLHQGGIIHRDLKVENLLLDENYNIKLIDFGLSNTVNVPNSGERTASRDHCKTQCGSPAYAAPEILGHLTYGTKVDVWSIGVNMYAMLTGKLPYTAEPFNIITLYNKMVKGDMNPLPDRLSAGCKDLLLKFLTFDPTERISIDEAIQHPWLRKGFEDTPLNEIIFPSYVRHDELNSDIINHMCDKMQFKIKDIIEGVTNNKANSASCVYHLVNRKLQRYLNKHPNTIRLLRRAKSRDDETDAVPKKQRIDTDVDGSNRILQRSRTNSLTSQALRSGASSSQGSRGIRMGSGSSSQGSQGPRIRLASDKDGTELKGSATIPSGSDHYLAVPRESAVQTSGAFTQLSVDIDDDEIDAEVEGHDPSTRKISMTYDQLAAERKQSKHEYLPRSPLTIQEHHQPTTLIIDDSGDDVDAKTDDVIERPGDVIGTSDGVSGLPDDVFMVNSDVSGKPSSEEGVIKEKVIGDKCQKDVGMAPVMGDVAKVVQVPVSTPLTSLMGPGTSVESERKSSLPSPRTNNSDVTRRRRGSLPSRTYPVTRDPSPIRKSSDSAVTKVEEKSRSSYGLICQVVEKTETSDCDESAQLMLRSTLSPLSVHCSPKPARRYSTPVSPMKEFYKEVLGFNEKSSPSPESKLNSDELVKGTRPFGSPVIARRFSTNSSSSDDRPLSPFITKIPLPVTPREPLLPNLELKLLSKHAPIEPISFVPLSPRKLSLDSKTRNDKGNEKRSRRRNTIVNPPRHDTSSSRDSSVEPRDTPSQSRGVRRNSQGSGSHVEVLDNSMKFDTEGMKVNENLVTDKDTLDVPHDESRDSDSSTSSQTSDSSKVRARVTVKQRRQTTELQTRNVPHGNQGQYDVISDDWRHSDTFEQQNSSFPDDKILSERTSESRNELRDKTFDGNKSSRSRDSGKVKARVTIKERRQTTELDTRAARNGNRIQFKITDTQNVTKVAKISPSRDHPTRKTRVEQLKEQETPHERRSSVPETSRDLYREQNGCLVRRSSVPALNPQNPPKSTNRLTNPEIQTRQTGFHRTLSESNAKDLKGSNDFNSYDQSYYSNDSNYGNPWLKHDKTIQRSIAMRAEMVNRKAEGGRGRRPIERARRHTVSTTSPFSTNHKSISSPITLKKSLV